MVVPGDSHLKSALQTGPVGCISQIINTHSTVVLSVNSDRLGSGTGASQGWVSRVPTGIREGHVPQTAWGETTVTSGRSALPRHRPGRWGPPTNHDSAVSSSLSVPVSALVSASMSVSDVFVYVGVGVCVGVDVGVGVCVGVGVSVICSPHARHDIWTPRGQTPGRVPSSPQQGSVAATMRRRHGTL